MSDDDKRWYMEHKDSPREPGDDDPPYATSIHIMDCGDLNCHNAHIVLVDNDDVGLAQTSISLDAVRVMLQIILSKQPGVKH